ncbi:MAG: TonB-dependent receptor [Verrucomicrobiaceae bacterium]|nr:TonB-dependent receptor [Verrucomicrobiaceae bacterium]
MPYLGGLPSSAVIQNADIKRVCLTQPAPAPSLRTPNTIVFMKSSIFYSLSSILLLTSAHAQQPSRQLPETVITAQKSPSITVPSITEKKEQIAKTVAGGANVVDAEQYKTGRAATLKDALDYSPGVLIQSRFGSEEARISIRGSGIQRTFHGRGLWLMQDGMPLNLADGGFDMQAIDPMAAQYIEVFRGANALQYGGTTLGGAVNFVSHTGHDVPALQTRFEAGSFNTLRAQISGGFVQGDTDGYAGLTAAHTDGFRDWSEQESLRFFANVGTKISSNLENRFYLTWVDSKSQLPGGLTKAEFELNPQLAAPANIIGRQRRDYQLLRLANKLTYSDGDNTLTFSAFWSWKDLDHPIFQVIDQLSNDVGFDLRYDRRGTLFGRRNDLTIGLGYMYGNVQDNRYANLGGQRGAIAAQNELQSANFNVYFQDQLHLSDTLSLIAGASVIYANPDLNEQTLTGPNNNDRQEYWGFSPKLGLLWDITPQAQVYFNASRSFEPPSFGELVAVTPGSVGLAALKPQTATTLELGTRGETDRLAWDFSYYYAWIDDEYLTLGAPGNATLTTNAGRTIHQGVEFALNAKLTDHLTLRQNFLWNDFRFARDAAWGDRMLPGVPPFYYRAELLYEHPSGFYAGPNFEWSPHRYAADLARTTFADPYALLGFKIGYRTKKGPSFFAEVRNIFDENYSPTTGVVQNATIPAQSRVFLPGDGRSFYAGVEWKW